MSGKRSLVTLVLLFSLMASASSANLLDDLERDIRDRRLDGFSHIAAAFVLSGAHHKTELHRYLDWYRDVVSSIRDYGFDSFDRIGSAAKVFSYLHATHLKHYNETSTTLIDIVNHKQFNCVSSTILYNLICRDLGWPTEAFETPTHTYTVFPNFTERIMVENTMAYGFNIMENLRQYNQYLLQYYPKEKRLEIGLDRIYEYENSNGRPIDNTELLGLLAYNRAFFARQKGDFEKAYRYVKIAQDFNRHSLSNKNFEINLYYIWGQKLYQSGQHERAFYVYADAVDRYWTNKDFVNNCQVAYFNAQSGHWAQKDWDNFKQLFIRMWNLDLLSDKHIQEEKQHMRTWINYSSSHFSPAKHHDVVQFWKKYFPNDPIFRN
ncbi:MAG: hypothetical protein U5R06_10395 [candidate division KSB1 bacterium]|nr:hypothetical protein [candidate division KSB1 bacterium]